LDGRKYQKFWSARVKVQIGLLAKRGHLALVHVKK